MTNIILFLFLLMLPGPTPGNRTFSDLHFLSDEEISNFTSGVYTVSRRDSLLFFERFPDTVLSLVAVKETWAVRSQCTSGVKISFLTNSDYLFISGVSYPNSPQCEPFILLVNEKLLESLPKANEAGYFSEIFELETSSDLKLVEIHFPAYARGAISKIGVARNAGLIPPPSRGILLAMGNSITQAGGAYKGYSSILARNSGLNLHNLGVGGHIFDSSFLPYAFVKDPDLITVAYGTNDWNGGRPPENIEAFFKRLVQLYEKTNIFVLEPLHRYRPVNSESGELSRNRNGQDLDYYRNLIRNTALSYPNIHVIDYRNILMDDPDLFTDGIHPTLEGHRIMGNNLADEIRALSIR